MKTVAQKLQIKPDTTVWVSDPASLALLGSLPAGVTAAKTIGGEYGLRPNSQVALDDVWSALRFRPIKPGEAPFLG